MKITMTKKDANLLQRIVNSNNVELGRRIETATTNFERNYHSKQLEEGRKLWSKLFDAQMREVK